MTAAPSSFAVSAPLRPPQVAVLATLAFLLASLSGCFGATIAARDLPAHLMARPIANAQTLDLSKLAGRTSATDRIVPGDVVEVTVAAGLSEDNVYPFKVRVDENGIGQMPHLGELALGGLSLGEAEATIGKAAIDRDIFTAPHVTVLMHEPKMHEIIVVGAVNEPGRIELSAGSADLLQAITAAGSLAENAGTKVDIKIPGKDDTSRRRPLVAQAGGTMGHSSYVPPDVAAFESDIQLAGYELTSTPNGGKLVTVDLASAVQQGKQGPRLPDGAVISIETRDPQPIFVSGLVQKPDRYDYPIGEELRLLEAISMAGDLTNPLANKVYVIRKSQLPNGATEHAVVKVNYQKAKFDPVENLVLMPGDEVSVERTPATIILDVFKTVGFGFTGRAF